MRRAGIDVHLVEVEGVGLGGGVDRGGVGGHLGVVG